MRIVVLMAMLLLVAVASTTYAQDNNRPSKVEEALYHGSQVTLIGGLVWDMKTTVDAISHPFSVSYKYCMDSSQTCQSPNEAVTTVTFNETGWAASSFGARHPASVVAANVALDAGILYASHLLYEKGGVWRKVAIGLNFVKAVDNLNAGMSNVGKVRSSKLGLVPAGAFSVRW